MRQTKADWASHIALAIGLFVFFYSPAYMDYCPFAIIHRPWILPPFARPLLLISALSLWLAVRTPGQGGLLLARGMALVPFLYILSIPHVPKALLKPVLLPIIPVSLLLSLILLSRVSPEVKRLGRGGKAFFLLNGIACFAVFFIFFFFMAFHGDVVPIAIAFGALVLLLALWAHSLAVGKGCMRPWLMGGGLVWALALCAFVQSRRGDVTGETKQGDIVAGPYLQSLHPHGITIKWETDEPTGGLVIVERDRTALESHIKLIAQPSDAVLPEGRMTGTGAVRASMAKIHEVTLDDLDEDTMYHYAVMSEGHAPEFGSFQTAMIDPKPFEFAVCADSSNVFDWVRFIVEHRHGAVAESILKYSPNARFLIHVGDMTFLGDEYPRWKKEFFAPASDLLRQRPLWTTLGNHERNSPWYFEYFTLPNEDERYYSFDFGNAHCTVLAVEGYASGHAYGPPEHTPMEPGTPQYEWLKKDLEASQDKTWHFVFFHHAALSSAVEGNYGPALSILAPLFVEYGVDVVFNGHDHDYEYSVKDGIVFIVTGGGGSFLEPVRLNADENPYSRYYKPTWHHLNVAVDGPRLEVKAVDLKGRVVHRFSLDKSR